MLSTLRRGAKAFYSYIKDQITFTPAFKEALSSKIKQKKEQQFLRLQIEAGEGCEGYTYKFKFDDRLTPHDYVTRLETQRVHFAVHEQELRLIRGATLDYVSEMMREVFEVRQNPNAEISCSCKTSFSPKEYLL